MRHFTSFKIVIVSLFLTLGFTFAKGQQSYVKDYKSLATELSSQYGIPATIILSIAFVESGGGTSKNSKILNNHFGIAGKNTVSSSKYKSFSSVRESYEAFCQMVSRKKYYAQLKGSENYAEWVKAMAAAGYSTQPEVWKSRINSIISKISN
ncbi:glucosaminidase domain-containing protein [Soonwooa sp.]|uniref:glucosaminidase domain-containing protein n=1 Tax=Soonwooa sp. TaxID=1938592 RepID=UPI002621E616|nr:glucosaminidase domain-containing protein [Soonwooa sp.]